MRCVTEEVKSMIRRLPCVPWVARQTRRLLRLSGNVVFSETPMRLAETYLRHYYAYDTARLWGGPNRPPEWFDHRADLYRWSELRNPLWLERGVFSREVMFEGCRVLDLCCGDGFYPFYFYSGIASHVEAVDRDPTAIAHACKWHSHPRIKYTQINVVSEQLPGTDYDVITWDAAIEHFSTDQIRAVLGKCTSALRVPRGLLCGYTILARAPAQSHPDHQHEFGSAAELRQLLSTFFPFVGIVETEYPTRHNLYFRAAFDLGRLRRFD